MAAGKRADLSCRFDDNFTDGHHVLDGHHYGHHEYANHTSATSDRRDPVQRGRHGRAEYNLRIRQNDEAAYRQNGGPRTFMAYSPATGQSYTMTCDNQVVCTGANNASVYFAP